MNFYNSYGYDRRISRRTLLVIGIVILVTAMILFAIFGVHSKNKVNMDPVTICAKELYAQAKEDGMSIDSQCLGTCGDYAVDIVHDPRTSADDLPANQCDSFLTGKLKHFIELDRKGNMVRIAR